MRRIAFLLFLFVSPVLAGHDSLATETRAEAALALEVDTGQHIRLSRPVAAVFVANPEVADVQVISPRMLFVFGKRQGETTLFASDENDGVLLERSVVISQNLERLSQSIAESLPDASIALSGVDGGVLLTGRVKSPADAETAQHLAARYVGDAEGVVNEIHVDEAVQVHLKVRVAEVSRQVSKQFGINWEAITQAGNFSFALARGADIATNALGQIIRPQGVDALFGGFSSGSTDINGFIDALAEEGLITILAEPSLTAKSGEMASFLAGGEFPIPVPQDDGKITIQFKEFGVKLDFRPVLSGRDRISIRVRPEVSQLSTIGSVQIETFEIPSIVTHRAETTVELGSGQSFAIAGLLQENINEGVSKFPFLGDVPVLGALFRSSRFQRDESELVIIVTPYIVRPAGERLALPTDHFKAADDLERIWEGRLVGRRSGPAPGSAASAEKLGRGLSAPVGFILE